MRQSGWLLIGLTGLLGCSRPAASPLRSRSGQAAIEEPTAPDEGAASEQPASVEPTHAAGSGSPEAATEDDELYDYQNESLGVLRFGMTADRVEALLGRPAVKNDIVEQEADGLFVTTWDWPALGVSVELAAESAGGRFEVQALAIRAPSQLTTARGIGLGARAPAIVQAYGAGHTHVSQDAVLVGSPYGGLRFELEQGAVRSIFIGAAAE